MAGPFAQSVISWLAPSGATGSFTVTQGSVNTLPAGSTITISLTAPTNVSEFQVTFSSDNGALNGFSARGYPNGSVTFTLPLALSVVGMTVLVTGVSGGTHKTVSTLVYTIQGDVDYGQKANGNWTVVGIQNIPVPVPSGVKTVLEFNAGSFSWATVAGVFTPGADLTGTSTQQWIDAISGSGGTGGNVPLQNNAVLIAGGGSNSDIDLSNAAAANGTVKALRILAPSHDTANAGALTLGTTNATSIQLGSAANTTGNVQVTVNAAGAVKHTVNTATMLQQGGLSSDFALFGASGQRLNVFGTGLGFGVNVASPSITQAAQSADLGTQNTTISAQGANTAAVTNVNGGFIIIKGGGAQNNGNTGLRGGVQLNLSGQVMAEVKEVAVNQRVLALVPATANGINSTNVPANGGDRVIWISNAANVPSASPTGGAVLFANNGALWIQESGGNNFQIKAVTGLGPSPTWANDLATSVTGGPQWVANISGANGNTNVAIAANVSLVAASGTGGLNFGSGTGASSLPTGNVTWAGAANKVMTFTSSGGGAYINIVSGDKGLIQSLANGMAVDAAAALSLGTANATSIAVGRSGIVTTVTGGLTQLTGVVNLLANAASSIVTSAGALTVSGAAGIALQNNGVTKMDVGATTANVVTLGAAVNLGGAAGAGGLTLGALTGGTTLPTGAVSWTGAANAAMTLTSLGGGAKINIVSGDAGLIQSTANGFTVDAAATLSLGTANSTAIAVGRSGTATTITGGLIQGTGAVNLFANAASQLVTTAGAITVDPAAALNLGTVNATSAIVGSTANMTSITVQNASGNINLAPTGNVQLQLGFSNNDFLKVGSSANNGQTQINVKGVTFGAGVTLPVISQTARASDLVPTGTNIWAQSANSSAATNTSGGVLVLSGGAATNAGNTGTSGPTRLVLNQVATSVMLEVAELNVAAQRVVALARLAAITTTQLPTNGGDGVVYIGNATANPTANAVSGATLWASGATLWASKGFSVAPAGTSIWDAGTTNVGAITYNGPMQGSVAANNPVHWSVTSTAINVNVNITLTNTQYCTPVILLTGTVPTGNCQVFCPNVVGAEWTFDIRRVTMAAANFLIFACGSGANTATINTGSLQTGVQAVKVVCSDANTMSLIGS